MEPATEAVLQEIPRAGVEEVDAAVARAKAAYPAWRALAPGARAGHVWVSKGAGAVAAGLAAVNIFGGFLVTQRMLSMYRKKDKAK